MRFVLFLGLLFSFVSFGQEYWQQEVNYKIDVELNDELHQLYGNEEIEYINNSSQPLTEIYFHLWPNAYKDKNSALARQQYSQGDDQLTFGKDELKGFIDSLDFHINGSTTKWNYHHHHEDICIVQLPSPLAPGSSIKISTPFRVQLPSGSVSRLGHIGQSYQITQWYPKPAVYDKDGWHHMPYLNQGEFFSEYGSFDVSITLPKNYVIGATGDLQTESEILFMNQLAEQTKIELEEEPENVGKKGGKSNTTPESDDEFKTIRFTQDRVHDFAWFADKRYRVLKGEIELPHSKRKVNSWALFTPKNTGLWRNAIEYINDGTYYYSLWNGDYPYNNVTAVDGTISAGGGMEYPNVTVIGNSSSSYELEVVIVHEVGHNWFYGQLGSNERVHGWMDEGMNTLNEVRYVQTKYPENTALSDMVLGGKFHFDDLDHHDMSDFGYRLVSMLGEDQPIETHSAEFSPINYGVVMYQKTGLVFFYLKDYLGDELFDKCMQNYYSTWEFKHPQPEDMRISFEKTSGKDLSWLFEDLIMTTNHVDFKYVRKRKHDEGYDVIVKNKGQVNGPVEIAALKEGKIVETKWAEPGDNRKIVHFNKEFDEIQIDPGNDIPEINRQNNQWTKAGLFGRLEKPSIEFLIGDNERDATNIFWTPIIGGNYYDKFMIGIGVHNYGIPLRRFNYLIMPYYSFGRQFVSGISEMSYTSLPKNIIKLSRFGLSVKSFKNDTIYQKNESHFISVSPYWFAKLGNRRYNSKTSHQLRVQSIYKKNKFGPHHSEYAGAFIAYTMNYNKQDHKAKVILRNDFYTNVNARDEIGRLTVDASYKYRYKKTGNKSWVSVRGFIGKQYHNVTDNSVGYQYTMSLSGADGSQDLFVEQYYFGRHNFSGLWSQQRNENLGGFKSTSRFGTTSDLLVTGNLYVQLPIKTGIFGVYADFGGVWNDLGFSSSTADFNITTAINTGLALRMGETFAIYFPIWMSKILDNSYGSMNYAERIRFTLKFNLFQDGLNLSGLLN